ncbi:protein SIEVE ELEMENT OCCLUSION B-like [Macadamia integrifolia]|uniref:protein SIEVE ELEMENT OCCLUSION B-like n=1 Tax=Macadamia integrifolia TaxID=60698 RepID=UPI001C4E7408|nr:protein SIEVE ELEMENT OCCLUSION B-like [Macadamia integrifolia]
MEQSLKQTVDGNRMKTNNDDEMIMVIQKTHSPDGKYFELELLLQLVKKMLTATANQPENESMDEKALQEALGMPEALAATIHKISCELCCNCSGRDELSTTSELFKKMSSYSWDTKVVLALAAFALFYGELNLVAVTFSDHPIAKAIKLLKQFPQESRLFLSSPNTLTSLIEAIVIATIRVVNFNRQFPRYFSTHSHTAVYWIVRSVVACAFHIMGFVGLGYKSIPQITDTAATEFSRLKDKVSESQNLLERWYWQRIGAREREEIFSTLDHLFQFETTVIDNTEIFKILFNAKDEQQPLLKCFPGKQERQKQAILYEVVWLRLLDKTKVKGDIQHTQITLPWYIVHYDHIPSINEGVTMYIKKKWLFNKKSILVMLDEQGKIVSPNAIHRLQIFGRVDFNTREEYIWKKVNWGLEFWFDYVDNDKVIYNWIMERINEGRYFCLYGGGDLDWIQTFRNEVRKVEDANIKFEMM